MIKLRDNRPDSWAALEVGDREIPLSKAEVEELIRVAALTEEWVTGRYGSADVGWCVRGRDEAKRMKPL